MGNLLGKSSCLDYKSKGEPQVRHMVLLVIAWDQGQVCHPPSSSEEVPSVLLLRVSVTGQAVPYTFVMFPKSSKEISSQMNTSRVLQECAVQGRNPPCLPNYKNCKKSTIVLSDIRESDLHGTMCRNQVSSFLLFLEHCL